MKETGRPARATHQNRPQLVPYIDNINKIGRQVHQRSDQPNPEVTNIIDTPSLFSLTRPETEESLESSTDTITPITSQKRTIQAISPSVQPSNPSLSVSPQSSSPSTLKIMSLPFNSPDLRLPGPLLTSSKSTSVEREMEPSGSKGKGRDTSAEEEKSELRSLQAKNEEQRKEIDELKEMMKELYIRTAQVPSKSPEEVEKNSENSNETNTPTIKIAPESGLNRDSSVSARDLQISDAPKYTGPSRVPGPLIRWIDSVEHFFLTKGVLNDREKLIFAGNLLEEVTAKDFYFDNLNIILEKTWEDFMIQLKTSCLKPFWQNEIMSQIQKLAMRPSENFGSYCRRARGLQREVGRHDCNDLLLAQFLELGLPEPFLKAMRRSRAILVRPFIFIEYATICEVEYDYLVSIEAIRKPRTLLPFQNRQTIAFTPSPSILLNSGQTTLNQFKEYCIKEGICTWCRTKCGAAPGQCVGRRSRARIEMPNATPAKMQDRPGQSILPPVGRASTSTARSTSVRPTQINSVNEFPDLGSEDIAAMEDLASIVGNERGQEEGRD